MTRPYEIWINGYYHMSGGIRALHVLKDELIKRGYPAHMRYEHHDPESIAVYPEIVSNNPDNYKYITRWKLNHAVLPDDGLTFAWEKNMDEEKLLTVSVIEPHLWTPYDGPRSGVAYWIGKGSFDSSVIPEGAFEINRGNFTQREVLADRIKTLDYLISFDSFTAVNLEAILCGTPVVIISNHDYWTREKVESHDYYKYGVSWGMENIEKAREEVHLAFDNYQSFLPIFDKRIDDFIQLTQDTFI